MERVPTTARPGGDGPATPAAGAGPGGGAAVLGDRLRDARRRRGLTQARLAAAVTARAAAGGEELRLSASAVSRWESGRFAPAVRYRPHLEAVLGIELASPPADR